MTLETQVFDLNSQNEKLTNEINKIKGSFKLDEDQLRIQIEEEFKQRLDYKQKEVEDMILKLARITQEKIDLTTRCARLDSNNQELAQENNIYQNKLSSLEMELEMTKENSERDSE